MADEDIDLDRVIVDPDYRRQVIAFLNGSDSSNDNRRVSRGISGEPVK